MLTSARASMPHSRHRPPISFFMAMEICVCFGIQAPWCIGGSRKPGSIRVSYGPACGGASDSFASSPGLQAGHAALDPLAVLRVQTAVVGRQKIVQAQGLSVLLDGPRVFAQTVQHIGDAAVRGDARRVQPQGLLEIAQGLAQGRRVVLGPASGRAQSARPSHAWRNRGRRSRASRYASAARSRETPCPGLRSSLAATRCHAWPRIQAGSHARGSAWAAARIASSMSKTLGGSRLNLKVASMIASSRMTGTRSPRT